MKQYQTLKQLLLLFTSCLILLSCKNTAYSAGKSGGQNFSVRYNYLYHANELIKKFEEQQTTDYNEDYDQILPVFKALPIQTEMMNKVILKANIIITEKNQSAYVDEAYMLLSKAYFYNRDFFSSLAYLDILINEYKEKQYIYSQALALKVRCLLALGSNEEGLVTARSLSEQINEHNRNSGDIYAALAAAHLANNQTRLALPLLQNAVQQTSDKEERARWTYICAQLHEQQLQFAQAITDYSKVKKSNTSFPLQLSAALKEITLSEGAINRVEYDKAMNRLLRNADYEENRDQIFYQLAKNAWLNKSYQIAEKYYGRAIQERGKNLVIRGLSFSKIAELNLHQFQDYQKAEKYYDSAVTILPKTLIHVAELDRIDNLRTVSSIYLSILEEEALKKDNSSPPYNQKVINGYYEIATIYLQKIKDFQESQRIYELLQSRFPDNSYNKMISYALKNSIPGSSENPFLNDYQHKQFNNSVSAAADINKQRNPGLVARKKILPVEPTTEKTKIPELKNPPANTLATTKSQIEKKPESEKADYYFIISVNDVSLTLSPSRYGIGEFNRSRYAESNLRHKLLEFDNSQVIYIGLFKTMEEAKIYSDEITPQLSNIIKIPKGSYTSTIMSKENLEKLETLEILKQK